jgi:hypothetical protein
MESLESREEKRKGSLFRQSDSYLNFFLLLVKGGIRIIDQRKIPTNLTCSYEPVTITLTMPLNFTSDPAAEPTTIYHDDDESFVSDDGTEGTGHDSRVSASEFDGDVKTDMPDHILFSELECRRQVTAYKNDSEGMVRVCGNKFSLCGRAHFGALRYGPGVYKTTLLDVESSLMELSEPASLRRSTRSFYARRQLNAEGTSPKPGCYLEVRELRKI